MLYGIVHKWFAQKGFGFIRPDRGADVFFHFTAIGGCVDTSRIEVGQPVKYELEGILEPRKPRKVRFEDEGSADAKEPAATPRAKMVELIDKIPGAIIEPGDERQVAQHHPKARRKKPTWRG